MTRWRTPPRPPRPGHEPIADPWAEGNGWRPPAAGHLLQEGRLDVGLLERGGTDAELARVLLDHRDHPVVDDHRDGVGVDRDAGLELALMVRGDLSADGDPETRCLRPAIKSPTTSSNSDVGPVDRRSWSRPVDIRVVVGHPEHQIGEAQVRQQLPRDQQPQPLLLGLGKVGVGGDDLRHRRHAATQPPPLPSRPLTESNAASVPRAVLRKYQELSASFGRCVRGGGTRGPGGAEMGPSIQDGGTRRSCRRVRIELVDVDPRWR